MPYWRCNLLDIDLSEGSIKLLETPERAVRGFLGGRGLNMLYLYSLLDPSIDPLSPENPLIFGTGLLTGTGMPNSGRFSVSAKSPESKVFADANCGGFFGPELRFAGYDRVVIRGRCERLSYIFIDNGKVEIKDAEHLRGLGTRKTQEVLRRECGRDVQIACIGEAGEKLVRFASIINGVKNSAGRGGLGAVMGSKNLKALVVRGEGAIPIAKPNDFVKLVVRLKNYLQNSKIIKVLGRVGTPLLYEVSNTLGAIRTKNSQLNAFEETLNAEVIHEYVEKMLSCYGCVVHCRHRNFAGEGPEYTSIGLLGANLGISNPVEVIELQNLCNDLGLDTASAGTILAWAYELAEKGYIRQDMRPENLKFGDFAGTRQALIDISKRKGIGDILAESTRAVDYFGRETASFLIAIKGLPQSDPHDVRYIKSFALGIATASRGADHLRSRPTLDIFPLPKEVMRRIYGEEVDCSPTSYKTKEVLVTTHEDIYAVIDSLGICKFVCHSFNSPRLLKYEHMVDMIDVTTGLQFTEEELRDVGRRVIDLERIINLSLGIKRSDDTLPDRYFDEEMKLRIAKGHKIDRDEFSKLLTRYYLRRGWTEDGEVKEERVEEIRSYRL